MIDLLIFVLAIVFLYILSRLFIQRLFIFLYRLTRSRERASVLLGVIFLPGTFIHEISHFLSALLLLVPVGRLSLMPEVEIDGIKLGSVEIAKCDFVRGTLIGLAPVISGITILFLSISYFISQNFITNKWVLAGLVYLIFQITHTMFSSKRDLHAALELIVFTIIISLVLVYFKIFWPFEYVYNSLGNLNIQNLLYVIFVPISLELIFMLLMKFTSQE